MKSKIIKRLVLFMAVLGIWYISTLFISPVFIPSIQSVFNGLIGLIKNGQLIYGIFYSFSRITIASVISASIAIPVGMLVCLSDTVKEIIYPIVNLIRYIPVTAFYPLLIMWCGINESMKIAFLFLATFLYMLPSVVLSLEEISPELLMTAKTMGMSRFQVISKVILPESMPDIMQTFVMMYGIGWTYIAVCEQINAKYGLGYIIYTSSARGRTELVFAAIITIMVISVCFDTIANRLIKKYYKWRFDND